MAGRILPKCIYKGTAPHWHGMSSYRQQNNAEMAVFFCFFCTMHNDVLYFSLSDMQMVSHLFLERVDYLFFFRLVTSFRARQ
jgi:hypothetical protein